ncbi:DUF2262 domain-containing protein [Sphingomonas sp.]|uniref:DUF2262 domain-containing protein n=1 Tax=Sphingomonas sp. TaxID=28214 RepID=UPI001B14A301|nr:DUF2262 domain-containing protein [Sphingomonas sp.]MBO9713182.1 DUF2262 domain-containing protein [Sphingomonas sp.]
MRNLITSVIDAVTQREPRPPLPPPCEIDDPVVGCFRLQRAQGWFQQDRRVADGRIVRVILHAVDKPGAEAILPDARDFQHHLDTWLDRMKDCAVAKLMTAAREHCADYGVLGPAEFKAALRGRAVGFHGGGRFDAEFDAGEIFGDRTVCVYGTLAEGVTRAEF